MFTVHPTPLAGLVSLEPKAFTDHRGSFVKTFHAPAFQELGLPFEIREEFFSLSHRHVLRGLHFQAPPTDHAKLVYCPAGAVLDVVLDLRRRSPTCGQFHAEELTETNRRILFIPSGLAHGFLTLSESALMVYKTTSVHDPACDQGIRWDSIGFPWPLGDAAPILSRRDAGFPALADFVSPF
jgi:dTDP-4-dehydrorhamnose 3,5-epimerase